MRQSNEIGRYAYMENERPALVADVRGSSSEGGAPQEIIGLVKMYWLPDAVYVEAEFEGLPASRVFGFHVHDGLICAPLEGDNRFSEAGEHFNNCGEGVWCSRHPYHAGDLPPVFSDSKGNAFAQVYMDRAVVSEYSGKPVLLHEMPDDLTSQPSGNSGGRIACGLLAEFL